MNIEPLGLLRTCWPDRWGVPRQAGLVPESWGRLELADGVPPEALRGLEAFSHVWLLAWLHGVTDTRWTVRPPRLGGERLGVLATRSPHRPSRVALSAVQLVRVDHAARAIEVSGHDLLDSTPILDVKPYVPYADALPDAIGAWAAEAPERTPVALSDAARRDLDGRPALEALVVATRAADPRQGSRRWDVVRVRVQDVDVHARADGAGLRIERVVPWNGGEGS